MLTLFFMRHAESVANRRDVLASRLDFALTEKGRTDAGAIAADFAQLAQVDRILSSPLSRARETARIIAAHRGVPVEVDDRITEQALGAFSGMSYADLETQPDYMHDRTKRWNWVPKGGGESYEMIAHRLKPLFGELDSCRQGAILLVTHAVTMRIVKALLENTLPNYPSEIARNGEIWKVTYRGLGHAHRVESLFPGRGVASASRA